MSTTFAFEMTWPVVLVTVPETKPRPAGAVTGTYYVLVHPEIADGKDFMVSFINPRTNPKCQQGAAASPPGLDVCLAKLTLQ